MEYEYKTTARTCHAMQHCRPFKIDTQDRTGNQEIAKHTNILCRFFVKGLIFYIL